VNDEEQKTGRLLRRRGVACMAVINRMAWNVEGTWTW